MLVTFHDVAACFSEKEWKHLHEWQKELYRNVMKEIHQALTMLGYEIVNPDTLLRIYKGEEVHIQDPQDPTRKLGINYATSDCHPAVNPDIILRIKNEREPYCRDLHCPEETGIVNSSSTNGLVRIKRREHTCLNDSQNSEDKESIGCFSTGQKEDHSVISFIIKEEEETCSLHHQDSERREGINNPTGDPAFTSVHSPEEETHFQDELRLKGRPTNEKSMNRKDKAGNSFKYCEAATSCKPSGKGNLTERSQKGIHSGSQLWSDIKVELEGEKNSHCESGLSNPTHSSLYQEIPKSATVDKYNTSETALGNSEILACQKNTQSYWSEYNCTECGESFRQSRGLIRHLRTHSGERPYQCTVCSKSFNQKHHLVTHQRTHTGERPYQCTECKKSFSRKEVLVAHQRTHTGERPYHCNTCMKSFTQKGSLIAHERTHSGERPYQCIQCKKSFTRKKSLIAHQRTHIG